MFNNSAVLLLVWYPLQSYFPSCFLGAPWSAGTKRTSRTSRTPCESPISHVFRFMFCITVRNAESIFCQFIGNKSIRQCKQELQGNTKLSMFQAVHRHTKRSICYGVQLQNFKQLSGAQIQCFYYFDIFSFTWIVLISQENYFVVIEMGRMSKSQMQCTNIFCLKNYSSAKSDI